MKFLKVQKQTFSQDDAFSGQVVLSQCQFGFYTGAVRLALRDACCVTKRIFWFASAKVIKVVKALNAQKEVLPRSESLFKERIRPRRNSEAISPETLGDCQGAKAFPRFVIVLLLGGLSPVAEKNGALSRLAHFARLLLLRKKDEISVVLTLQPVVRVYP